MGIETLLLPAAAVGAFLLLRKKEKDIEELPAYKIDPKKFDQLKLKLAADKRTTVVPPADTIFAKFILGPEMTPAEAAAKRPDPIIAFIGPFGVPMPVIVKRGTKIVYAEPKKGAELVHVIPK